MVLHKQYLLLESAVAIIQSYAFAVLETHIYWFN
jgi:hypothetical protein